jgi:hypothetical protein
MVIRCHSVGLMLDGKSPKLTLSRLKCICNENFDFVIFALSENLIFSDHFNTNLVENFELEVCEFCV